MKQYLQLAKNVKSLGTPKPPARSGMPGTISLFGDQIRFNLADGFPIPTTKKLSFKNVITELIWFLRGDINIKYLVDNKCNIWNEDAYNYYLKQIGKDKDGNYNLEPMSFEKFIERIKDDKPYEKSRVESAKYKLGDCGFQYGRVWRSWETNIDIAIKNGQTYPSGELMYDFTTIKIDQIKTVLNSLINNPESRRHIVSAIDPANDTNLALYWCHAMFQFNCRPIHIGTRIRMHNEMYQDQVVPTHEYLDSMSVPKYYLDCQLYQRSADLMLGVPYNIASYALLTEIFAVITNMIAGDFIHTFGDVHIYTNHLDAINEQLKRTPTQLPKLKFNKDFKSLYQKIGFDALIQQLEYTDFELVGYEPQEAIKAKLSTGLQ